jgi:hypothetical protein
MRTIEIKAASDLGWAAIDVGSYEQAAANDSIAEFKCEALVVAEMGGGKIQGATDLRPQQPDLAVGFEIVDESGGSVDAYAIGLKGALAAAEYLRVHA